MSDHSIELKEIWKDIPGFEGYYKISNLGRVKSLPRKIKWRLTIRNQKGKLLKPAEDSKGYYQATLSKAGKDFFILIHRLVAAAFIPNPLNKPQVNHKDGNPKNNTVINLEWCTSSEDAIHASRVLKRMKGFRKMNWEKVDELRKLYREGVKQVDLCKLFDLTAGSVSLILSGKQWNNKYK